MTSALSALTAGLVDYAGLFPPAALAMPAAVEAYARHAAGDARAMLGRFVLPIGRLDEFAAALDALPTALAPRADAPWRLSVLAGAVDATALAAQQARLAPRVAIDTIEAKAESPDQVGALAEALGAAYTVFVEIPVREDPAPLVKALAAHGLRAKVRTGGVSAEAFPTPAEVLRFLRRCHAAGVPFKATAGLHHPLRGEFALTYAPDAPRGTMHGFLNVFLAAALLRAGATDDVLAALLEERDAAAFTATADGLWWRGTPIPAPALAAARAGFAGSFGSCSFDEPTRELLQLFPS